MPWVAAALAVALVLSFATLLPFGKFLLLAPIALLTVLPFVFAALVLYHNRTLITRSGAFGFLRITLLTLLLGLPLTLRVAPIAFAQYGLDWVANKVIAWTDYQLHEVDLVVTETVETQVHKRSWYNPVRWIWGHRIKQVRDTLQEEVPKITGAARLGLWILKCFLQVFTSLSMLGVMYLFLRQLGIVFGRIAMKTTPVTLTPGRI